MPGFHNWYIRKRWIDHNGWESWVYISVNDVSWITVSDPFQATPFKTKAEAERAAFGMTIRNPELIANLVVELL